MSTTKHIANGGHPKRYLKKSKDLRKKTDE